MELDDELVIGIDETSNLKDAYHLKAHAKMLGFVLLIPKNYDEKFPNYNIYYTL